MRDLVAKLRPGAAEPGEIVDETGTVLGRHDGVIHFTVGQRKGLGIAAAEPLYVLRLEPEARRVVVGPRAALGERRVPIRDVNWLARRAARTDARDGEAALGAAAASGTLALDAAGGGEVVLDEPALGVAPGQACVFYDGARVLGGGWIRRAARGPITAAPSRLLPPILTEL